MTRLETPARRPRTNRSRFEAPTGRLDSPPVAGLDSVSEERPRRRSIPATINCAAASFPLIRCIVNISFRELVAGSLASIDGSQCRVWACARVLIDIFCMLLLARAHARGREPSSRGSSMIANILNTLLGLAVAYAAVFGLPAGFRAPWPLVAAGIAIVLLAFTARRSDFSGWQSGTNAVFGGVLALLGVSAAMLADLLSPTVMFWVELWVGMTVSWFSLWAALYHPKQTLDRPHRMA